MTKASQSTKYAILVGDGMGDYPLKELEGKTPLEVANTPHMDQVAACRVGLAKTIPDTMEPGSDIANLSLLGYDPTQYHTGRAPLEAASMNVKLGPGQVAFRMNLVTLDWRSNEEIIMVSNTSGDISTLEGAEIIKSLKDGIQNPDIDIYSGVAYRHLLVWANGPEDAVSIPPHDVLEQNLASYLNHDSGNPIPDLITWSWQILKEHPVNRERKKRGLKAANSIWPWGQGKASKLPSFQEKYGLHGSVISAVDLLKGIGICVGLIPIYVEGATGYLDTNYRGKVEAAIGCLEDSDFVFVHVEAPDEAGHHGDFMEKIQAIENFDQKVVGPVLEGLKKHRDYRVMVASDHFTPIVERTHTREPTPFAWASKREIEAECHGFFFSEADAKRSGLLFERGHDLLGSFLSED
jgi:2,3-bisphosphoglycerate-independent phosphoglycerate mutase